MTRASVTILSLAVHRKLHPEIEEEGLEPFEHFKQNRRTEICVRGRAGLVNRRYIYETACGSFGWCCIAHL